MIEIMIRSNLTSWEAYEMVISELLKNGYISHGRVILLIGERMNYLLDFNRGWTTKDLYEDHTFRTYEKQKGHLYMILPDPQPFKPEKKPKTEFDPVCNPSHYTERRKYEPRKVIADWGLNFNLGNAVKYIARAGRKGDNMEEDLKKAIQYIKFELEDVSNDDV